jgi:hypothetical protein
VFFLGFDISLQLQHMDLGNSLFYHFVSGNVTAGLIGVLKRELGLAKSFVVLAIHEEIDGWRIAALIWPNLRW